MKTVFLILTLFCSDLLFAINGELFFHIDLSGVWTLRFEKIEGEFYYNQSFSLANPPNYIFSGSGLSTIIADAIFSDNNFGTIDDNGNEFLVYYGKYKVTITYGGSVSKYFYMEYKDCEYNGTSSAYADVDVYFRFNSVENAFIRTDNNYSGNFGNYTWNTFYIWELKYNPEIVVTDCFNLDILVRNKVNDQDYGVLTVDGQQVNSGSVVSLSPGWGHIFSTYTEVVLNDYKFRDWSTTINTSYNNPSEFYIGNYDPVIASFYPTLPLTVTNNLEGGTGGSYQVRWNKQPTVSYDLNSGESYDAFDGSIVPDNYTITAHRQNTINTEWYFTNWSDGENDSSIIEVITNSNKDFTANYKGHFRSNQADAFTSNSQNKLIRQSNGLYHPVYTSYDKL